MLYIEDDKRDLWPAVAAALVSLEPLDMVLYVHEGDGAESFAAPFEAPDAEQYLEPVPASEEGPEPLASLRVPVNEELVAWLQARTDEFEEWGNSLAIYRPGKWDLVAAVIPHEGLILVDDEFGSALAASGYRPSSDPPDWW